MCALDCAEISLSGSDMKVNCAPKPVVRLLFACISPSTGLTQPNQCDRRSIARQRSVVRILRAFVICCLSLAASPALAGDNSLVVEGREVETLAEGFKFAEGPARAPNGDLYFADFRANKIHRWNIEDKTLSTITEDSHGVNGMQFDAKGRLLGCQGNKRRVVAMDAASGLVLEVLADNFGGKRFNNPNDLWIDPKGGIYFTDPAYSRNKSELELDGRHVYYIAPGDKQVVQVTTEFNTPNGIVGTPDGKTLYITDRRLNRTWRYAIQDDGTLADRTLFCKVGADGMTLDERGNLYTTPRTNAIRVFALSGKELPPIPLPTPASNVCFAGQDGKTLFITSIKALYSIQMNVSGQ